MLCLLVLLVMAWPVAATADCFEPTVKRVYDCHDEVSLTITTGWGADYCLYANRCISPYAKTAYDGEKSVWIHSPTWADSLQYDAGALRLTYDAMGHLTHIRALYAFVRYPATEPYLANRYGKLNDWFSLLGGDYEHKRVYSDWFKGGTREWKNGHCWAMVFVRDMHLLDLHGYAILDEVAHKWLPPVGLPGQCETHP